MNLAIIITASAIALLLACWGEEREAAKAE